MDLTDYYKDDLNEEVTEYDISVFKKMKRQRKKMIPTIPALVHLY